MSKGSSPRPFSVSQEEFANRFDAIFSSNKAKAIDDTALNVYNSECPNLETKEIDERTLDRKI